MTRTWICKGAEAALPINTGTATSFSEATVVRLTNTATGNDHLVTVVETRNGDVVGSFTMLRGTTEFLVQKNPTQCVFAANAAVKGAKVGFTIINK